MMSLLDTLDNIKDEPQLSSAPKFSVAGLSYISFLNKLEEGSIGDAKIKSEILNGNFFNNDYFDNPKSRPIFQKLWTNKLFLRNLLELLDSDKSYRDYVISSNITFINHTVYDYMVSENPDEDIKQLMFDIAKVIDYSYIIKLCTIMPLETARFISLVRFSSFDKKVSIDRFNSMIFKCGIDFSKKDIIYIYGIFFSDNFSFLFTNTMTSREEVFAERIHKKVYDMISLALLDILESMTSDDIYKVLYNYSKYVELTSFPTDMVRFSLRSLSDDYSRINNIITELLNNGVSVI